MKNSTLGGLFLISTVFLMIIGIVLISFSLTLAWGTTPYEYLAYPGAICLLGGFFSFLSYLLREKDDSRKKK